MAADLNSDASESAVLLVAHGSRVAESNREIEALAALLAKQLAPVRAVSHAFLELASPSIPEEIDSLAHAGVKRIVLIPYFLSAGRHVSEDIPALVEAAHRRNPGLRIEITGHFGAQDRVPEILSAMVSDRR